MTTEMDVLDIRSESTETFVSKVTLVAAIHREALGYLYGGDSGYIRMYSMFGIPETRPVFQVGRSYRGASNAVLDAAVHNASLTARSFTGSPENLPLTTMVVGKYNELTSKETHDA